MEKREEQHGGREDLVSSVSLLVRLLSFSSTCVRASMPSHPTSSPSYQYPSGPGVRQSDHRRTGPAADSACGSRAVSLTQPVRRSLSAVGGSAVTECSRRLSSH
eukprot:755536-Hanusia_phi.AAC.1